MAGIHNNMSTIRLIVSDAGTCANLLCTHNKAYCILRGTCANLLCTHNKLIVSDANTDATPVQTQTIRLVVSELMFVCYTPGLVVSELRSVCYIPGLVVSELRYVCYTPGLVVFELRYVCNTPKLVVSDADTVSILIHTYTHKHTLRHVSQAKPICQSASHTVGLVDHDANTGSNLVHINIQACCTLGNVPHVYGTHV